MLRDALTFRQPLYTHKMNTSYFYPRSKCFLLASILSFILSSSHAVASYPNYFEELIVANKADQAEELVESAMLSILQRIQIPYLNEHGQLESSEFFQTMEKHVEALAPGTKLYISGGVTRSLLGSLYQKLYDARQKDPNVKVEAVLNKIAHSKKTYPATKYFGSGSDLDILFVTPASHHGKTDDLAENIKSFINSAETKAGLTHFKSRLKKSIVAIGDIKPYDSQI
jgi:hypothetical protein